MNSQEPIFLPEQQKNNDRQAWTCFAIAGLAGCAAVVILGLLVWSLMPKDSFACTDWLPQNISANEGGQIAFVSDRDGNPEIYVIDTDGTGATRLTDHPAGDYAPAWSPDGARIAFYSERDGNAEIYVINADGSGLKRLTNDPANDYAPAWSPDGTRIAFHSHRYKGAGRIFVMNADGSGVKRLTSPEWDDWSPAWSPDGAQIVFNSSRNNNRDIWLMNADGSKMTNLTRNPADDWWPDWAPDGKHIVFHSDRDDNFEIYTINVKGSGATRLTDHPASDYDPAWSPDAARIAFTSDRCGNGEVFVMKADGSTPINLTRHAANDWAPAWRPDNTAVQPTTTPIRSPPPPNIEEWHRLNPDQNNPTPEHEVLVCERNGSWNCSFYKQAEPALGFEDPPDSTTGSFSGQDVTVEWICPGWFPSDICDNLQFVASGVMSLNLSDGGKFVGSQDLIVTNHEGEQRLFLYWTEQGFYCPWYEDFDMALAANPFPTPFNGQSWPLMDCKQAP